MIIHKIEIYNFRSYYKSNVFELGEGLNLIIGSNGDGKTTLYDALSWLFLTDNTNKENTNLVSRKRLDQLSANESDNVRVAMTYEHKGAIKVLKKEFRFTKSFNGDVSTSNYTFTLTTQNGVERIEESGINFDKDLPSDIRQFIMLKGETELDILQRNNALKMLIETFSDVKDFEAYFSFMKYAMEKANLARDNAQKTDTKNAQKISSLNKTIEREKSILAECEDEIICKEQVVSDFEKLLLSIEKSQESSKELKDVNSRIATLTDKKYQARANIKEDYSIYLLDDIWILMGFEDIAEEYSKKVGKVEKLRRDLNQQYLESSLQDKLLKKLQTDFTPLPVHIPGEQFMQEMLDEEVCKICGRKAAKNTEPWKYMQQRLEELKESLKVKTDTKIKPLYENEYVVELQKQDTILNYNLADITKLRYKINESIAFNNSRREEINIIDANLNLAIEEKKRILSQVNGLSEEQLLANYENITNWYNSKNNAENRINTLKRERVQHRSDLESAQTELNNLAEGTTAAIYAKAALLVRQISDAFKAAKENNKRRLLQAIEDESNIFLGKLNSNDFKGTIRIHEKPNGQGEAVLVNNDNTRILNPNTALRTTYLMSVLFAIGKLSAERDNSSFPLIFDAPTSSFTDAKESEFFNVISNLDKQIIIVTKSYLKEGADGNVMLDKSKVDQLNGRVFRIEKMKPFDDKNLGTIQTVITRIK